MRTRSTVIAVVVVALLAASMASAWETGLPTSRYMGLAGAGLALTRDASAVDLNPAALAVLEIGDKPAGAWEFQLAGTFEVAGDLDVWGANFAGAPAGKNWGLGFSYYDASPGSYDYSGWTVGFGKQVAENTLLGLSVSNFDEDSYDDTIYNIGGLFLGNGIDWGFVLNDITEETMPGMIVSAGAKADLAPGWTAVFDALDITDRFDQCFAVGVEFAPKDDFAFRAGMFEGGDFSAGVGFNADRFAIDVAYVEMGDGADDSIFVTASTNF